MKVWLKAALTIVATLTFIAVGFGVQYRDQAQRAERRASAVRQDLALCRQNLHQYVTLHDLIEELGKPDPQGSVISRLVVPPGTPPWFIDILRQLSPPNPQPPNLDRFYAKLGTRPQC